MPLSPCPFCGVEPRLRLTDDEQNPEVTEIFCILCDVSMRGSDLNSMAQRWNRQRGVERQIHLFAGEINSAIKEPFASAEIIAAVGEGQSEEIQERLATMGPQWNDSQVAEQITAAAELGRRAGWAEGTLSVVGPVVDIVGKWQTRFTPPP